MTINNLLHNVETIRLTNAVAAAQTAVETSAVDMANRHGARFTVLLGDVASGSVLGLKAQHSDTGSGDWVDLEGVLAFTAGASDADNKLLVLDVIRPERRYLRVVLSRGTANAAVDGVLVDVYGHLAHPVTQGSTVLASDTLANPSAA